MALKETLDLVIGQMEKEKEWIEKFELETEDPPTIALCRQTTEAIHNWISMLKVAQLMEPKPAMPTAADMLAKHGLDPSGPDRIRRKLEARVRGEEEQPRQVFIKDGEHAGTVIAVGPDVTTGVIINLPIGRFSFRDDGLWQVKG